MNADLKYRPDIDGLRAIAIIAVIIFHVSATLLPGGFIGVDVFFVISGFLITSILIREFNERRFSFLDFYGRRARRIFPSLLLVLSSVWIAGRILLPTDQFLLLGKHIYASTFFFQNINLQRESSYFDLSSDLKPLLHLWSLSVEEQFYIFWPILLGLAYLRRRWVGTSMLCATAVSLIVNVWLLKHYPVKGFYKIESRFWELAAGGIFAFYIPKLSRFGNERFRTPSSYFGVLILLGCFIFIDGHLASHRPWMLIPVFATGLIIYAGPRAGLNERVLSSGTMVKVGLISYPLYLWHWPLLSFASILSNDVKLENSVGMQVRFGCAVIAVLLAWCTFEFLEKPFRKLQFRFQNRFSSDLLKTGLLTAGLLLVSALGYSSILKMKSIEDAPVVAVQIHHSPEMLELKAALRKCPSFIDQRYLEMCATNAPLGPVDRADVVIIGDSHAQAIAPGLSKFYSDQHRFVHMFGNGNTLGFYGIGNRIGGDWARDGVRNQDTAFSWAIEHRARTVVLVSQGPIYVEGREMGHENRVVSQFILNDPEEDNQKKVFETGLRNTLELLQRSKIQTVLVLDNPEMGFNPAEVCFQRENSFSKTIVDPCAVARSDYEKRARAYRDIVSRVVSEYVTVKIVDLAKNLCDANHCYAIMSKTLLYEDSNHLSVEGSLFGAGQFKFD